MPPQFPAPGQDGSPPGPWRCHRTCVPPAQLRTAARSCSALGWLHSTAGALLASRRTLCFSSHQRRKPGVNRSNPDPGVYFTERGKFFIQIIIFRSSLCGCVNPNQVWFCLFLAAAFTKTERWICWELGAGQGILQLVLVLRTAVLIFLKRFWSFSGQVYKSIPLLFQFSFPYFPCQHS